MLPSGAQRKPLLLTDPGVTARVCEALRGGSPLSTAAAWAGISAGVLDRWLRLGRRKKDPRPASRALKRACVAFVKEVSQAMAAFEVGANAQISLAGKKQWQAKAWQLERLHPDKYGTQRVTEKLRQEKLRAETARALVDTEVARAKLAGTLPADKLVVSGDAAIQARILELLGGDDPAP